MHRIFRAALFAGLAVSVVCPPASGQDSNFLDNDATSSGRGRASAPTAPSARPSVPAGPPTTATRPAGRPAGDASEELVPAVRGLPPPPGSRATYRIGPDDILKVQVFEVDELSSEEHVNEEGQIVMPLIGEVKVAGLTPKEAESRIAEILSRDYMQDPQVDVSVKVAQNLRVTVLGSVAKPGVFPITGSTTLLQAIALAGGAGPLAKEGEVILFRPDPAGAMMAYVVDLKAIQQGKLRDPVLVADDRVMVPESGTAAFFTSLRDTLRGFVAPLRW